MCGIAGLMSSGAPVTQAVVAGMASRLARRGPDAQGVWIDPAGGLGLGHRRLSVVDLSDAGLQPMASACGRYMLSFNGEVYNHRALRRRLDAEGAAPAWAGRSDTEVVLAAIAAWGLRPALERMAGMFAIALWDRRDRTLTLARDRFGEKPLFYGWTAAGFAFASTLSPIRATPGFANPISMPALASLMARAYVAAPLSIFGRVFKLPAGCLLTVGEGADRHPVDEPPEPGDAGPVRLDRFFDYADEVAAGAADLLTDEDEMVRLLEEALGDAVSRQLAADVPVGTFLSGGIDSSLVTAFAQARSVHRVQSFTIGFDEAAYDEARHAKAVAAALGTDHHELYVRAADVRDVVPRLPDLYDEPFADSSQLPTHLLARLARARVTVALSGDGGDELFGGYNRHIQVPTLWRRIAPLSPALRRVGLGLAGSAPPIVWNKLADLLRRPHAPLFGQNARRGLKAMAAARDLDDLLNGFLDDWAGRRPPLATGTAAVALRTDPRLCHLPAEVRMMHLDAVTYLPDDILVKVDRAAMGASLETRVPFLDPAVTALAARIPLGEKIRAGQGKLILKRLLHRHVPRALVDRPKAGFAVPVGQWLCGPLRDWAEALLSERALSADGLFDVDAIRGRWHRHLSGRDDSTQPLWSVLMFQAWRTADASQADPA